MAVSIRPLDCNIYKNILSLFMRLIFIISVNADLHLLLERLGGGGGERGAELNNQYHTPRLS